MYNFVLGLPKDCEINILPVEESKIVEEPEIERINEE